jgi:hypothetical protein
LIDPDGTLEGGAGGSALEHVADAIPSLPGNEHPAPVVSLRQARVELGGLLEPTEGRDGIAAAGQLDGLAEEPAGPRDTVFSLGPLAMGEPWASRQHEGRGGTCQGQAEAGGIQKRHLAKVVTLRTIC